MVIQLLRFVSLVGTKLFFISIPSLQIRNNNSNHGYTIIARLTLLRKEGILIAIMVAIIIPSLRRRNTKRDNNSNHDSKE